MPGLLQALGDVLEHGGVDLRALGFAWARAAPSVAVVPAFGLRALPAPARVTLAVAIGASVAPALVGIPAAHAPWPVALLGEMAKGVPVALTAAVALWAAGMAGGAVDDLRGGRETVALPHVEPGSTPTGALLSMLIAIVFLEGGGPARIASALARPDLAFGAPLLGAAHALVGGIELAIAVATPVLVASIVVEVTSALVARAASPAFIQPLLAPVRSLVLLAVAALVLERMTELVALAR
jgi:type III secretory pathway component EscT